MALSTKRIHTFAQWLDHPECIAVHPDGSVWAGGEAGQIYRVSQDGGKIEEVARAKGGFMLGLAFSPGAEYLLACDLFNHCVWKLRTDGGKLTKWADGVPGHQFAIPNHLVFARNGEVYITESGAFGGRSGKILKFDSAGRGKVWHEGPFAFSNGITLNAEESAIYVVCTGLPGVERIDIRPDGSAGRRRLFVKLPRTVPDGLAFDAKGILYVSCYTPSCIYKVTPNGKATMLVEDWTAHALASPTNIAFGGERFDQLFTANLARWHIARVDLRVKGKPLASHSVTRK